MPDLCNRLGSFRLLPLRVLLDQPHQFGRGQLQRVGKAPERLEIGLLASVLDHGQVASGQAGFTDVAAAWTAAQA